MAKARLHNNGDKVFVKTVSGKEYSIDPGKYLEASRRELVALRGAYTGFNAAGERIVSNLYLELLPDEKDSENYFQCQLCGDEFKTQELLVKHSNEKHANDMVDEKAKKTALEGAEKETVYTCPFCLLVGKVAEFHDKRDFYAHVRGHEDMEQSQKESVIAAMENAQ